ncbi:hypothetical protein DWB85_00575 [Seongchinamella sediminis]|uniref:General secretion pathway protein K n=1 Tax=Seongchinamella sediminis TaxID=2283635 RepID=A0A3L7E3X7_9GAMM|nr:hypothetical protein [Seongchinamella sediminis]RLQ23685.1 hypothetical protein DWB85_00575 [Seongchinamella sediminis]
MKAKQGGVALAIVVWFIAGMSLLVAGIVSHARTDTRTTQVHLARAKAVASGDGAIQLAMVERNQGFESAAAGPMISESRHRLGELEVRVQIVPAAGFVDVNHASGDVLAALFRLTAGMTPGDAKTVADNVLKWRQNTGARENRAGPRRGSREFYSLEDMLRVEGVNRALLDAIRDYVVVGNWSSGRMNWSASPGSMMQMLEQVNPEQSGAVGKRRDAMFEAAAAVAGSRRLPASGVFRADAYIGYGGRTWLRRRWLKLESGGDSSLPWRVVRTEAPRVVGLQESKGTSDV